MKKKIAFIIIPVIIVTLFGFSWLQREEFQLRNDDDKIKLLKRVLFKSLQRVHFKKMVIDNAFSRSAFDLYLEKIDPNKRYLTQADYERLLPFKEKIDDDIKGVDTEFFETAFDILINRIKEAEAYYKEILARPFDFSKDEFLELNGEKKAFAADSVSLKKEWQKYLKYLVLIRFNQKVKAQEITRKKAFSEKEKFAAESEKEIEAAMRGEVRRSMDNLFDLTDRLDEEDYLSNYLNALLSVYGPHTEYLPPQEKENFDISMSGKLEGIGAQLTQSYGEIKVAGIVPGAPSWRQKELKQGDIILKVAQGMNEPISVENMSLKDAVSMIRGKKGTEVRLTVKKPDGRILVIAIIRDEVILEDSYVKSAIIKDKNSSLVYGIISLPSFYADFSKSDGGRRSYKDVKNEIIKLKQQEVDAIVLDLRNNGGGSLDDAVSMSGLFIEEGPIVQVQDSFGKKRVLKDKDANVVWDGPLAVMINKLSASASEILAAAMQDYDRAIIVGSPSSYGKGTVQRFLDLDQTLPHFYANMKPFGSVKLTIHKFYRINGGATQVKGVVPEILLPDIYNYLEIGEKYSNHVMPWDEIAPVTHKKHIPSVSPYIAALTRMSEERVINNEVFLKIDENARRLKKRQQQTWQTLNYDKFRQEQIALEKEAKKFDSIDRSHTDIEVMPLDQLVAATENTIPDSAKTASLAFWEKRLEKDSYVYEATRVLQDYIGMDKNITKATSTRELPKN